MGPIGVIDDQNRRLKILRERLINEGATSEEKAIELSKDPSNPDFIDFITSNPTLKKTEDGKYWFDLEVENKKKKTSIIILIVTFSLLFLCVGCFFVTLLLIYFGQM